MTKIATLTIEPAIATALGDKAIIVVRMGDRLVKHQQQLAHQ